MGTYYVSGLPYSSDYLEHYGITGQKWGVRRFQNPDGTRTEAGKKRYGSYQFTDPVKMNAKGKKEMEEFERIKGRVLGSDGSEEDYKEHNRIQDLFNSKFNDGTFNESLYNIPKTDDAYKGLRELDKAYSKTRGLRSGYTYNEKTGHFDKDEKQYAQYKKAWDHYWNVRYDFAGKALRSIGYEDTKEAREFVDDWFKLRG